MISFIYYYLKFIILIVNNTKKITHDNDSISDDSSESNVLI